MLIKLFIVPDYYIKHMVYIALMLFEKTSFNDNISTTYLANSLQQQ